jgi:hypothetical protein
MIDGKSFAPAGRRPALLDYPSGRSAKRRPGIAFVAGMPGRSVKICARDKVGAGSCAHLLSARTARFPNVACR